MTTTTANSIPEPVAGSLRTVLTGIVLGWFALVLAAYFAGLFSNAPGAPPLQFAVSVLVPIAIFLAAYAAIPRFRAAVVAADLALLTAVQAWRVLGGVFVVMLAFGYLPGLFAWPAGLGDVAVGLAAPFVALAALRRPQSVTERGFAVFHWLGILDLAIAVGTGVASSGLLPGLTGSVTTAPMNAMPLVLIPGFLVPLFVILHLAALLKVRHLKR
ncbi:MAG TPA: hypothetical protein VM325_20025 [Alphaproteobacteria bacterium]|nr:hypothetical protein [Alphaproteobacteria bacterium]